MNIRLILYGMLRYFWHNVVWCQERKVGMLSTRWQHQPFMQVWLQLWFIAITIAVANYLVMRATNEAWVPPPPPPVQGRVRFVSSFCEQLLWAAFVSSFCEQLLWAAFVSSFCEQLLWAAFVSSFCEQLLWAACCSASLVFFPSLALQWL